jgi:hypothetical protein
VTGEYSILFSEWFTTSSLSTSFFFHWLFLFAWFILWIFNIAHINITYCRIKAIQLNVFHNIIEF